MKHFKKRTIALVLASVITVAGSFASSNYKNSLMSLTFETLDSGDINMSVETKSQYNGNVTPIKRDANTYMLMLSEIDSKMNGMPNLEKVSGAISSVDIKTLPYSNNAKGYTKIIIKTNDSVNLHAENKVYIPSNDNNISYITDNSMQEARQEEIRKRAEEEQMKRERLKAERLQREQAAREAEKQRLAQQEEQKRQEVNDQPVQTQNNGYDNTPATDKSFNADTQKDPYKVILTVLLILAFIGIVAFLGVRASNKIQEFTGERIDIDTDEDDDTNSKKGSKRKKIKNKIKQLDSTYSKSAVRQTETPKESAAPIQTVQSNEELNIVDLDELFKEQAEKPREDTIVDVGPDDAENDALADFLSGFSFDDTEEYDDTSNQEESQTYDEELYEKVIQNKDIAFSNNDIDCIKQLLNKEINDDTMSNIAEYAVSNPIGITADSKEKVLENLVATYKISQDISFNQDDIAILRKLMSVEIDSDFLEDLRTNPERTLEVQREIEEARNKSHRPSEILTLNVKDMLPDLSEELRKQGGKKIESEAKATVVYASEGYEFSTLSLNEELPDLSKEIYNESAYISKPSADWNRVDNSWEVETLKLSDSLPDLTEALKHPEEFEKPKEEPVEADADALLNNITNVQFKPFYDGSETFEVLNDFETPSMNDIQNEFKQFDNFEISHDEFFEHKENSYDNVEALYQDNQITIDKEQNITEPEITAEASATASMTVERQTEKFIDEIKEEVKPKVEIKESILEKHSNETKSDDITHTKRTRTERSENILQKIQQKKAERQARKNAPSKHQSSITKNKHDSEPKVSEIKCIIDGETYSIISTTVFDDNKGCHLAKKDKNYIVLGYIDKRFIKIKEYDSLKSERITSRLSEKISEGVYRYIVRVGLTKFIVNVTDDNIEYLMAL